MLQVTGKRLGYVCDARPMDTVDRKGSCHFPFKHQGITHDTCVAPEGDQGASWCATKVLCRLKVDFFVGVLIENSAYPKNFVGNSSDSFKSSDDFQTENRFIVLLFVQRSTRQLTR